MNATTRLMSWFTGLGCLFVSTQSYAAAPAGYVDASTYGYNTTDATAALQAALNSGQNVYIPNMGADWVTTPLLVTRSNQNILLAPGVVIAAKAGEFMGTADTLFRFNNVSNSSITGYGATLRMRKADYLQAPYPEAQWRTAISLTNVNGFSVNGLRIEDTGGDAVYIAGNGNSLISRNVTIKDVHMVNNYRQGISVVGVDNLLIDNVIVRNTSTQYPASGIDFEPNYPDQAITNVTVRNSIFQGNDGFGIMTATTNSALPHSINIENVTIIGNERGGIRMSVPLAGVSIKNAIIVDNDLYGFRVDNVSPESFPTFSVPISYSALRGNNSGALNGNATLGTGSITNLNARPVFVANDPDDAYYLYLHPDTPTAIKQGADNGAYMGARPVYNYPATAQIQTDQRSWLTPSTTTDQPGEITISWSSTELVVNGDFENATWGAGSIPSTKEAMTGSQGLRSMVTGNVQQDIIVNESGATYVFSGYAGVNGGNQSRFVLTADSDVDDVRAINVTNNIDTTGFAEYTQSITLGTGTSKIRINLNKRTSGGMVYWDDISLRPEHLYVYRSDAPFTNTADALLIATLDGLTAQSFTDSGIVGSFWYAISATPLAMNVNSFMGNALVPEPATSAGLIAAGMVLLMRKRRAA